MIIIVNFGPYWITWAACIQETLNDDDDEDNNDDGNLGGNR